MPQAKAVVEEKKQVFEKIKEGLTRELVRFEKEKAKDLRKALRAFARLQIQYAGEKRDALSKTLLQFTMQ